MSDNAAGIAGTLGLIGEIESRIMAYTGFSQAVSELIVAALVVAASIVLAKAVKHVLADLAPHLVSRTKTSMDDQLLKAANGPLQWLIVTAGVYLALHVPGGFAGFLAGYLDPLLVLALIFIAAYLLANVVKGLLRWYQVDIAPHTGTDFDDMLVPFLDKIASATIAVIAILVALEQLEFIEITPLVTGLGIAGIAVALAAKEFLSDFIGAVSILADQPYKVGDRVVIEKIDVGDVLEIGLRSTKLRTLDNRIIIVPNSLVSKSRIINYSMPDAVVSFKISVGIAYDADVEKAQRIMREAAMGVEGVIKDPPPKVYVTGLGSYSIKLLMYVKASSYKMEWSVPDRIYREVLRRFAEEGIEIPYPVTTVQLKRDVPPDTVASMAAIRQAEK